jgi:hypothetical protein
MRNHIFLLVLCLLVAACAKKPAENAQSNATEPKQIASTDVVKATPQEATLTRGQSAEVLVPIKIANGYHINANPPSFPYLKATELEVPRKRSPSRKRRSPFTRVKPLSKPGSKQTNQHKPANTTFRRNCASRHVTTKFAMPPAYSTCFSP